MAMIGGSVTVADDETETGTGLALALYLARKAASADTLAKLDPTTVLAQLPKLNEPGQESAKAATIDGLKNARLDLLRGLAADANVLGPTVVAYIQANAEVSLTSVVATVGTSAVVGRMSNPVAPDVDIQGPSAPVALPVTGPAGVTKLGVQ